MTMLTIPARWYSGPGYYRGEGTRDGYQYGSLELELARTAFMIVDSDCGRGVRSQVARMARVRRGDPHDLE